MPTHTQLTGASIPLFISGKEFPARTLTDKDHCELDEYVRSRIIQVAKDSLNGANPIEREEILGIAIKTAARTRWHSIEGNDIMSDTTGTARLGWQMIKHKIDISFEDFRELVVSDNRDKTLENLRAINTAFIQLNIDPDNTTSEKDKQEEKSESELKKSKKKSTAT